MVFVVFAALFYIYQISSYVVFIASILIWAIHRYVLENQDSINAYSLDYKIKEIYTQICRHYNVFEETIQTRNGEQRLEVHDELCFFGFSRGAFLARCVTGLIWKRGLLKGREFSPMKVTDALRRYKESNNDNERIPEREDQFWYLDHDLLAGAKRTGGIKFMGLFDTVHGLSKSRFQKYTAINYHAGFHQSFCHIMATHQTSLFESLPFSENVDTISDSCLEIFLPGDHCDIGGGWVRNPYENKAMSNASLALMAKRSGLKFTEINVRSRFKVDDLKTHNSLHPCDMHKFCSTCSSTVIVSIKWFIYIGAEVFDIFFKLFRWGKRKNFNVYLHGNVRGNNDDNNNGTQVGVVITAENHIIQIDRRPPPRQVVNNP